MRAIDQRFEVMAFHKLRPFQYRHAPSLPETAALVITRDLQSGRLGVQRGEKKLLENHECQCGRFLSTFWIPEMKLESTRSRLWSRPDISFQKYNYGPSRKIYTLLVKERTKLQGRQYEYNCSGTQNSPSCLPIRQDYCFFPVKHSLSLLFADWFCRWRQASEELHTGRTDHKQLIVSRGMDAVIWNQHWTASLPLSYPIILHSRSTRGW